MFSQKKKNAPPPPKSRRPCLLIIFMDRRACERKFDEWLFTDLTIMSKKRKVKNLIAEWSGKGLPD